MRTIVADVTEVANTDDFCGETLVWSSRENALYWINVSHGRGPALHRLDPGSGSVRTWPMPERIGSVALKQGGGAIVALASGVHDLDLNSGALSLRAPSPLAKDIFLHEGRCDPFGRFWIGSCHEAFLTTGRRGVGFLYRLDGKKLTPVASNFTVANSLAVSQDGRTLYIGDSISGLIRAWDCDSNTGALTNEREFIRYPAELGKTGLDGAAIDCEGCYWSAAFGEGTLKRWRPDGTADMEIKLPFPQPTMLNFGGKDLDTIYVTTAWMMLDEDGRRRQPQQGRLFALKAPVKGIPEPLFRPQ
jgi:sugar lactone lactonase YvrE